MEKEIATKKARQVIESEESPPSLELQVMAKLYGLPSDHIGIWSTRFWGEIGVKLLQLENNGHVFNATVLGNEGRLEISVTEEFFEDKRRKWYRNLGLTEGGMIVDNTTLHDLFVKEIDLQGTERPLNSQEADQFFQELIEARVISVSEPKTGEITINQAS